MPRLDTKRCYLCNLSINVLAGFVQLGITKYAHLKCYTEDITRQGVEAGRRQVLDEQAAEAQHRADQEADRARIYKENLRTGLENMPRCTRCGRRMGTGWIWEHSKTDLLELAKEIKLELINPSTGALGQKGICEPCVEAERIASNAAKAQVKPPEPKPAEEKPKEVPKDRFSLIDMD